MKRLSELASLEHQATEPLARVTARRNISQIAERYAAGLRAWRSADVRIHPASRLSRYGAILHDDANGALNCSDEEWMHARLEGDLLTTVFDHARPTDPLDRLVIDRMNNGLAVPSADAAREGRDHEAELYVASIARSVGLEARLVDPPDVVVDVQQVSLGVAVKRPRSLKAISNAMREGIDQLARGPVPGVLWLDICLPFELHERMQFATHAELEDPLRATTQYGAQLGTEIRRIILSNEHLRVARGTSCIGVVALAHVLFVSPQTRRTSVLHVLEFEAFKGARRERAALLRFVKRLGSAV